VVSIEVVVTVGVFVDVAVEETSEDALDVVEVCCKVEEID